MKQQFNNKVFFILLVSSIVVGFVLSTAFSFLKGYEIYAVVGFFAIVIIIYSLVLSKKERNRKKNETDEKKNSDTDNKEDK